MPTYRRQDLANLGHALPEPAIAGMTGLRPLLRDPPTAAMRGQDKILPLSRRTVLSYGLRGDGEWRVSNADPQSNVRTHPDRTTWYVVARGRVEVTPGCFFEGSIAYVPSGETQRDGVGSELTINAYWPDGVHGAVRITVVWTDRAGLTETTTREIGLEGSTLEFGAEDTSAGGIWRTLRTRLVPGIMPPSVLTDQAELDRFSQHVTATITVEHQGSPRVVDCSISEVPVAIACTTASAPWVPAHMFAPGEPDGVVPPLLFPQYETTPTVAGTRRIVDAHHEQKNRLGPCLLQWTAYTETSATPTATIVARTTSNDGTRYESIVDATHNGTGPAAYNASLPGWSVSTGGYARRWKDANPLILRDRIAVIPVIVRAYGRGVTAGTSTVRVQTALHSYVDVVLPVAGSAAWSYAIGYLEVGVTPEQPTIAQVFLNHLGASGSLEVEAVEVYFAGTAAEI